MLKTLVVYSGKYGSTEDVAKTISLITGPAKYCNVENFKENYKDFDFFVIGAPIYQEKLEPSMVEFVNQNNSWLSEKNVSAFCTCLDKNGGIRELNNLSISSQVDFITLKALGGRLIMDRLDSEDCESIEEFLELVKLPREDMDFFNQEEVINFSLKLKAMKEELVKKVDYNELKKAVDDFIESHNTCTLASCHDGNVRATPIEYNYFDNQLYLLSEGGEKFSNILLNSKISLSIYDSFTGMNSLAGMQITGNAFIVQDDSEEYQKVLEKKGLSVGSIKALDVNMNMIKIQINKVEFLNSKFKEQGSDSRQIMKFE